MQYSIDKNKPSLEAVLEEASGANDRIFLRKIIIYVILLSTGFCLVQVENTLLLVLGVFLIGSMFAHGVELSHQLLHGTGFKSRKLSNIIGSIMCTPMLISFRSYQLCHLRHHAFVGTKDDTEFFEFNMLDENVSWGQKILSFTMITHYFTFCKRVYMSLIGESLFDFLPSKLDEQCRTQYLAMSAFIILIVLVSFLFNNTSVLFLWAIPLLLVAGPLHTLIELPEHSGCDQSTQSIYENTRSIDSNGFLTWFVNGNNYHVEHHQYPLVRPEHSSKLHQYIKPLIKNKSTSYRDFVYHTFIRKRRINGHVQA